MSICNVVVVVFSVIFLSGIMDIKIPKVHLDNNESITMFLMSLILIFLLYAVFGEIISLSLISTVEYGKLPIPNFQIPLLAAMGTTIIFTYRLLLYMEHLFPKKITKSVSTHHNAYTNFFNQIFINPFLDISKIKNFVLNAILVFILLNLLYSTIGISSLFPEYSSERGTFILMPILLGILFIVIELWVWFGTVQYSEEILHKFREDRVR